MKIKKQNLARLASISALGAGALGLTTGTAEAGIIYTSYTTPPQVGFSAGFGANYSLNLAPGEGLQLAAVSIESGPMSAAHMAMRAVGLQSAGFFTAYRNKAITSNGTLGAKIRVGGGATTFGHARPGQKWNSINGSGGAFGAVAVRESAVSGSVPIFGEGIGGGSGYYLFEFPSGGQTDYGWIELSTVVSGTTGPDTQLLAWAYDNTGQEIGAGDMGQVPEPSTLPLAGLAALALGATGLRRWRASGKKAA